MSSQPARVIQFPVCPAEMACMPASIPLDLSDPAPQSPYVSVAARKGVVLLRPTGPHLNHREAGIVLQEGREALERHGAGLRRLVIDLTYVQMMSSFGMGMCIELRNIARAREVPTILFGTNGELCELLGMMKVDRLFTMVHSADNLAKALAC